MYKARSTLVFLRGGLLLRREEQVGSALNCRESCKSRRHSEFPQDATHVVGGRAVTDPQDVGDLSIAFPRTQERQDLALAQSKSSRRRRRRNIARVACQRH